MKSTSLCGLGQLAPNPVLTTLRYFRDEYEAHIKDKSCPALVCKELTAYYIEPEKCVGCLLCKNNCSVNAIKNSGESKKIHVIDQARCVKCGACFDICPVKSQAVSKLTEKNKAKNTRRPETGRKGMKVTIDGRPLEVADTKTILDLARDKGIIHPFLCHYPGLVPFTGCRLCLVAVKGREALAPACGSTLKTGWT